MDMRSLFWKCLGSTTIILLLTAGAAFAHCDTVDGPVIIDAKTALQKSDVTPVLKWVSKEHEQDIRVAFQKTVVAGKTAPQIKEFADNYFFETLVRIHREGEGAPYTGLKPAGTAPEPGIADADKALETGSVDALVKEITEQVAAEIKERFKRAQDGKKQAGKSVEAGREYVDAYVDFIHYVEKLYVDKQAHPEQHTQYSNSPAQHQE